MLNGSNFRWKEHDHIDVLDATTPRSGPSKEPSIAPLLVLDPHLTNSAGEARK